MHFTYQEPQGDLQQGDVLRIDDGIRAILHAYHRYYATREDYHYLIVLTQSCDLVRHKGRPCKARYITLAAVRSLRTVLDRELEKHQLSSTEKELGLCAADKRRWMEDFLVKLLNNNIPEYFYLAKDVDAGLDEPCVAFLKLAIPVKSQDHYSACLAARTAQLKEVFQAKLGWLVGNMFSRVGTPDWVPTKMTKEGFSDLIEEILNEACIWIDQPHLRRLKKELKKRREDEGDGYCMSREEIEKLISEYAREQEREKTRNAEAIVQELTRVMPSLDGRQTETLRKQLLFNEQIRRFLK